MATVQSAKCVQAFFVDLDEDSPTMLSAIETAADYDAMVLQEPKTANYSIDRNWAFTAEKGVKSNLDDTKVEDF